MEDIETREVRERIIQWWLCGIPNAEFPDAFVKRALILLYGQQCQGIDGSPCGWAQVNLRTGKIPLQLDHINGDSTDNRSENVRLLCGACHTLTPTYGAENRGQGRRIKQRERQHINSVINDVARRTGRMPLIADERFVLMHEAVPGSDLDEPLRFRTLRKQRFRVGSRKRLARRAAG